MRHLILALMIALLPIRGWMGDAMAVAMLAAPAHGMVQTTAHADHGPVHQAMATDATHADGLHGDAAHHGDSSSADNNAHAHKSCEVCNGPAMPFAVPALPGPQTAFDLFVQPAQGFASAELRPGIKPPIS